MSKPAIEDEWPEFVQLKEQVIVLWFEMHTYTGLFCKDDQTVELLNCAAKQFFYSLNFTIPNNILRMLSAIYDNPQTGSRANITIDGVSTVARTWISKNSCDSIATLLNETASARARLRKIRNKKLSHLDHKVLLGFTQLEGVTRGEIESLAKTAGQILNVIQSDLFSSSTSYENPISHTPGDILACLETHQFLRTLKKHINDKKMTTEEAGQIVMHGLHGREWYLWCTKNKLDPKHHLPGTK